MKNRAFKLTVNSMLENIPRVGLKVRDLCSLAQLDETASFQMELCVVEAVTNCIKHAYELQPGHTVEIDARLLEDRIIFKIIDTGKAMTNLASTAYQPDKNNLDALPESGMGLMIIRTIMDETTYRQIGGKNELTMCKHLKNFDK